MSKPFWTYEHGVKWYHLTPFGLLQIAVIAAVCGGAVLIFMGLAP